MIRTGTTETEDFYRMKKLLSLALILCLLAGAFPGRAESFPEDETFPEDEDVEPAAVYDFDFTLRLYPDSLSEPVRERVRGYADLLEALRFRGTLTLALSGDCFDIKLSVIPKNREAEPIRIGIHGAEDLMYLTSPLLGEKSFSLDYFSFLAFCSKMSEHLDLPLHYLALLYPYTWKYSLRLPTEDWAGMVGKEDENGVIPAEAVKYLWECWSYRLERDEPTLILINTLCKDLDAEDAFRGMLTEIPDYFVKTVAGEQEIRIVRDGGTETWHTASGEFFSRTETEKSGRITLNFPKMKTGYQPVFSLETVREDNHQSGRLTAQILGTDRLQEDLLNLEASIISFPVKWPSECWSLFSLSLTGEIVPNVGASVYLAAQENGHALVEVRKPTVDMEPGALMLTMEGDLVPREGDHLIRMFSLDDLKGSLRIFTANDLDIRAYMEDLAIPVAEGLIRFLVGVPTSACQAVMDDLTDLGVLDLLLGE